MDSPRSPFLTEAAERGFVQSCTDLAGLDAALLKGPIAAYVGFDLTADSLHVGHLLAIMALRLLQKHGHRPVVLLGGGTSQVGDPSGKDSQRRLMDGDEIARNRAGVLRAFGRFLKLAPEGTQNVRGGAGDGLVLDNAAWLSNLGHIAFLREVGAHFSVSRMLKMDSVRTRLEREQTLSCLEFGYMLLQAYDFVELARRTGCVLQIGGGDQWGNIVAGVDLGRRMDRRTLFGLTTPLLQTAGGRKMGKTEGGAVWLNPDKLAPNAYWQFWRDCADADVGRFLRLFTDLPLDETARLESAEGAGLNAAKKILATEATALLHGREAAEAALATAAAVFEKGEAGDGLPVVTIARADLARGIPAHELFALAGLAESRGDARRLIAQGGLRVNGAVVPAEGRTLTEADLVDGVLRLSKGRKRHILARPD